ncbi:MAG TPA: aspartate/glutamate racemase family protein [Lacipirellulaceae bacterium]|nr:aspartate/glutamate racemase family protein [Lacipirellulaceae bacterium]
MTPRRLFFLHTSATLVPTFEQLCRDHLPAAQIFNLVDDSLIKDVIQHQQLRPRTARRVVQLATAAEDAGADVLVVTCSSIGRAVDAAAALAEIPVLRVDRALAERSVETGSKIGVIATLRTTLEPTAELIERCAAERNRAISLTARLCDGAFEALMGGDPQRHDHLVLKGLMELASQVDVVALAQASMARVVSALGEEQCRVPILASPPLAIAHLAQAYPSFTGTS